MIFSILILSISILSILFLYHIMHKNGHNDIYSALLFIFILLTWVIPILLYSNNAEISLIQFYSYKWIVVGIIYFTIQTLIRYCLSWLAKFLKSKKRVFIYLLLLYAFFLFSSMFMKGITIIYWLAIGSAILSGLYGLSVKYWMENTGNKKCYIANLFIYPLPLIGTILGLSFGHILNKTVIFDVSPWIFASLSFLCLIIAAFLSFLREKIIIHTIDKDMGQQKRFKNFSWTYFKVYLMSGGVLQLIYTPIIVFNIFYFQKVIDAISNDSLLIIIASIALVGFLTTIITSNWLIKNVGYMKLLICGTSLIVISILIGLITFIIDPTLWQIIFLSSLILTVGYILLHSSLYGDVLHISTKSSSLFLTHFLSINSIALGLGYAFTSQIFMLHFNINIMLSIILVASSVFLSFYLFITLKNILLLKLLRKDFVDYEFKNIYYDDFNDNIHK